MLLAAGPDGHGHRPGRPTPRISSGLPAFEPRRRHRRRAGRTGDPRRRRRTGRLGPRVCARTREDRSAHRRPADLIGSCPHTDADAIPNHDQTDGVATKRHGRPQKANPNAGTDAASPDYQADFEAGTSADGNDHRPTANRVRKRRDRQRPDRAKRKLLHRGRVQIRTVHRPTPRPEDRVGHRHRRLKLDRRYPNYPRILASHLLLQPRRADRHCPALPHGPRHRQTRLTAPDHATCTQ